MRNQQLIWLLKGFVVFIHLLPSIVISRRRSISNIFDHPCGNPEMCKYDEICVPDIGRRERYYCSCAYEYIAGYRCKMITNQCRGSNGCHSFKHCVPSWGHHYCLCDKGKGGVHCKEKFTGTRLESPEFIFDPIVLAGGLRTYHFLAYLNSSTEGTDLNFNIQFEEGHTFSSKVMWKGSSTDSYAKRFVTKLLKKKIYDDGVIRGMLFSYTFEKIQGAYVHVNFNFKNGDQVQFGKSWRLLAVKNRFECLPRVTLKDCSRSSQDVIMFRRRDRHAFRGKIKQSCPDLNSRLEYKWHFFNVSNTMIPAVSGDWKNFIETKEIHSRYLVVPPFSMKSAHYVIRLQVDEIVHAYGLYKEYKSATHHGDCYFGIYEEIPVARIRGGALRYATVQRALTMDGTESIDPNEDSDHQNLQYSWSCNSMRNALSYCKGLGQEVFNSSVWSINASKLTSGDEITFQLIVNTLTEQRTSIPFQQVLHLTTDNLPEIKVKCLLNCEIDRESNPQEDIVFEAICEEYCDGVTDPGFFVWSQYKGPSIDWANTESGPHSNVLLIKKGSLKEPATYGFTVTAGKGQSTSKNSVTFNTSKITKNEKCDISPSEGYELITTFTINCSPFRLGKPITPVTYEITLPSRNGLILDYDVNSIGRFELPRGDGDDHKGSITIVKTSPRSLPVTDTIQYQAKPLDWSNITDVIKFTLTGWDDTTLPLLVHMDNTAVMTIVSIFPTLIAETNLTLEVKRDMIHKIIKELTKVDLMSFLSIKQMSTAILYIIASSREYDFLDYDLAHRAVDVANTMSVTLQEQSKNEDVTTEDILNIFKNILRTFAIITNGFKEDFDNKTVETQSIDERNHTDYEFEVYSDITIPVVMKYKAMHKFVERMMIIIHRIGYIVLDRIKNVLTFNYDGIFFWLKVDRPSNLVNTVMGLAENGSYIQFSQELADELGTNPFGIQVVVFNVSPYWWHPSTKKSNSLSMSIAMKNMKTQKESSEFSQYLDLFLKPSETDLDMVMVTFNIPRRENGSLIYEDNIPIVRVQVHEGETIIVVLDKSVEVKLKVVIRQNVLPTLEDIMAASVMDLTGDIGEQQFVTTEEIAESDEAWFFVALAPEEELTSSSQANFVLNYSLFIQTSKCHFWDSDNENWSHKGCRVANDSTPGKLHCLCNHTSVFSGYMIYPHRTLLEFPSIPFSLSIKYNFNTLIFVLALLLVFLLLFFAARFLDKRDRSKRKMIILGDNSTTEHYAYLITVYTGNARNSGTTSTVAVQLAGSINNSKPHLLISKSQILLETGTTNWFVIFTRKRLGDIEGLYLWHNNTGHRPPWYCDIVVCRDIQTRERWVFLANRWLSVLRDKRLSYCQLTPATDETLRSTKIMLHQNIVYNFIENHLWLSVFTKHPQSFFTRHQRVAVLASGVTLAMLFNMIFYGLQGLSTTNPAFRLDKGVFTYDIKDLALALSSALVSTPLNFILSFLFRKTLATDAHISRSNQKKKKLTKSQNIYADVELERKLNKCDKFIFYSLPVDPLCQTQVSLEKRVFSRPSDSTLSRKLHGVKFTPFSFRPWIKNLTWTICGIIIVSSSAGVTFIGFYVGEMTSYKWMVSVIMIILMSALIVEPIKIVLISLIYTFALKVHPFDLDLLRGYPLKPLVEKPSKKQRSVRQNDYRPLPSQLIPEIRKQELDRIHTHHMVLDIFIHVLYAISIFWLAEANTSPYEYRSTMNVKNMFIDARYYGIPLKDVHDYHTLVRYLRETIVPTSNEIHILEEERAERTTWTADNNCQVLGILRLRQLRVHTDNTCPDHSPAVEHLTCQPVYSNRKSDTSNYGVGWMPIENMSLAFSDRARQPWIYKSARETGSYTIFGKYANYPGGGYVADLGRTRNNSKFMVDYVIDNKWIDSKTRFIAIDFTIYNVNVKLFNVVTIFIEKSATELYSTTYDIRTSKLFSRLDIDDVNLYVALVFYIILTCIFIYLQVSSIQRLSFKTHFQDVWNIADAVVTAVALISIIVFFARHQYVYSLLQALAISKDNSHINFAGACVIDLLLTYIIAFLSVAAILRIWRILRYLEFFYIFEQTFVYAALSVCGVLFVMGVFLVGFACVFFLTLGSYAREFLSSVSSLVTLVSMSVGRNAGIDYELVSSNDTIFGPIVYVIFALVAVIFLKNLGTAVIMEYYSVSKEAKERTREVHNYTFMDYVRDEYNFHFKKKRGPQHWEKQRLRGGADDPDDINSEFSNDGETSTSPNYCHLNSTTREDGSMRTNIKSKKSYDKENCSTEFASIVENQTVIDIQEQFKKCKTGINSLFSNNHARNELLKKRTNGISQLKDMFRNSVSHDKESCVINNEIVNKSERKETVINNSKSAIPKSLERKQKTRKLIHEKEINKFNIQLDDLSEQLNKVIHTVTINKDKLQAILQKKKRT